MKKQILKTILCLAVLFGVSKFSQAQSRTCDPVLDPDYCTDQCMIVDEITNNTNCNLDFLWLYQGSSCATSIGAGSVTGPGNVPTPAFPWGPACRKFCDDPCECPTGFWLVDPNDPTKQLNPWNADWSSPSGTVIEYCLGPCSSCGTGTLKVTMTVVNPGRAKFKVECKTSCP